MEINKISEHTRLEIASVIKKYILDQYWGDERPHEVKDREFQYASDCIDRATADQLWRLARFINQGRKFKIVYGPLALPEVIGIQEGGIFIGIEPDGYAHS